MNQQFDEMRLYFNRVHPMCGELFAMAYAICGDYDDAEYVLQKVILNCWHNGRKRRGLKGFHNGLREETRRVALSRVHETDDDWDQFGAEDIDGMPEDPVLRAFQNERAEIRRLLMLRYGCGLNLHQTGKVLDMTKSQVNQLIAKFQRKTKRSLDADDRGKLEIRLAEVCSQQLAERGSDMPDIGALYRNFEAEASEGYSPVSRFASKAAAFVTVVVLMAIIGCVIWGVSAVIRPVEINDSGLLTETLSEQ